ncbi:hypothetical protein ACI65C_006982 [Semiaphis heraclei]
MSFDIFSIFIISKINNTHLVYYIFLNFSERRQLPDKIMFFCKQKMFVLLLFVIFSLVQLINCAEPDPPDIIDLTASAEAAAKPSEPETAVKPSEPETAAKPSEPETAVKPSVPDTAATLSESATASNVGEKNPKPDKIAQPTPAVNIVAKPIATQQSSTTPMSGIGRNTLCNMICMPFNAFKTFLGETIRSIWKSIQQAGNKMISIYRFQ